MCLAAALPFMQFAIGAASAVVGFMGQQQQYAAMAEQKRQNDDAALRTYTNQVQSINTSQLSAQKKAEGEIQEAQIAGLKARGRARVAAGEAGVSGLSVDHLISDFYGQEYSYLERIKTNYETQSAAYDDEKQGARDSSQARINSVASPTKPSFLGAAIRIGESGLQAYGSRVKYEKTGYY